MLPAAARLRTPAQFAAVTRGGRRGGGQLVVVHLGSANDTGGLPRAGFVVSKKIGNAVTRNRVTRRVRAVLRERIGGLPAGTDIVVRALPAAADAGSAALGRDVDAAIGRALRRKEKVR